MRVPHPVVDRVRSVVRRLTGSDPPTCPWRAFEDPLVIDVLTAVRWHESGQLEVRMGEAPAYAVVEGVETFLAALEAVDADREKRRAEAAASKQRALAGARMGGTAKARR